MLHWEGYLWIPSTCLLDRTMLAFYSNRLGCLGSIVVSVIASAVLILLMRSCSTGF